MSISKKLTSEEHFEVSNFSFDYELLKYLLKYKSLWRNRLARSAVNRKVGGSSPPRDVFFFLKTQNVFFSCRSYVM